MAWADTGDVKKINTIPMSTLKPKLFKFRKTRKKKGKNETGCSEPLYGKKSKCVLKIVPKNKKVPTFQMDDRCKKKR